MEPWGNRKYRAQPESGDEMEISTETSVKVPGMLQSSDKLPIQVESPLEQNCCVSFIFMCQAPDTVPGL